MSVTGEYNASQDESHILHPSSRKLFRFWEAMRAENAAPRRDQLDLAQVRAIVPYLFIGEYQERSGIFCWRLAGTGICELYRRELTGTDMLAGWDSFEADSIGRFLLGTITGRQPCVLRFRFETNLRDLIGAELAGFPLTAADGNSTHILGGLFPFRETLSPDYNGLVNFELAAARSIWTENLPAEIPKDRGESGGLRNFRVITGGRSQT